MSSSYDHDLSIDDGFIDENEYSNFDSTLEENQPSDFGVLSSAEYENGPVLPEMGPEEGCALREWRRQNAIRLEEKEKKEKELLSQILVVADDYKVEFHRKREVAVESNKVTNREKEKAFIAGLEKFHAEADKDYWKSIAELLPKEIPAIEKRKGKKDLEKKPSTIAVQGPKPGKPTDLARMRGLLVKLKHDAPSHLKFSPPVDDSANTSDVAVSTKAVAVA